MKIETMDTTVRSDEKLDWWGSLGFFAVHAAAALCFWTGFSWVAVGTCLALYWIRMFGITAGFHRYFSHGSFKTTRWFQFVLALIGTSAVQKGPLWWASHHRTHHKYADSELDVHSPIKKSLWWSHVGWILCKKYKHTEWRLIPDWSKFPELVFLNRYYLLAPVGLAVGLFVLGETLDSLWPWLKTSGLQLVAWGFFLSTILLYHGTFTINSLAHRMGKQRFPTKDSSKNSFILSLVTLGEGWHNNHHRFPHVERQGIRWWEIDITHYVIKLFSWMGLVWGIKKLKASDIAAKV